jgi:hypothetical protein
VEPSLSLLGKHPFRGVQIWSLHKGTEEKSVTYQMHTVHSCSEGRAHTLISPSLIFPRPSLPLWRFFVKFLNAQANSETVPWDRRRTFPPHLSHHIHNNPTASFSATWRRQARDSRIHSSQASWRACSNTESEVWAKVVTGYVLEVFLHRWVECTSWIPRNYLLGLCMSWTCFFVYDVALKKETDPFVAWSEVLTEVVMKSSIFWNITPCSLLKFKWQEDRPNRVIEQVARRPWECVCVCVCVCVWRRGSVSE